MLFSDGRKSNWSKSDKVEESKNAACQKPKTNTLESGIVLHSLSRMQTHVK